MDKNEDPTGVGLSLTDLQYVFHLVEQEGSYVFRDQFIGLLELVFHLDNGLYCDHPECEGYGNIIAYKDIRPKVEKLTLELMQKYQSVENGEQLLKAEKHQKMGEMQLCPHCKRMMRDVYEFKLKTKSIKNLKEYIVIKIYQILMTII